MRKDRNGFFESSNYQMSAFGQNAMPNMGMIPNMSSASNNFYSQITMQQPGMDSSTIDSFDNRISKLERNIQRLEARLNKLEAGSINNNYDENSNMYMV